jgi:sialate O-acetylesterase
MNISASNSITLKDILVGDVWVCSGQSQMDYNMKQVSPLYEEEIKSADNPYIHYFAVPTVFNFENPQVDLPGGRWESISQKNIMQVSAIAYFFADELYNKYKIPIGMIRSSLGGSPAEAWMNEEALKEFPVHYKEAQKHKDTAFINNIRRADNERVNSWYFRTKQN